ncbi:hypothetical protein DITRI_Ditri03aG0005400 [Diplodiscus trichospermus]
MATPSGAAQPLQPRSGGKMVRPRRAMLPRTPYDRPRLLNSTQQNPNWISRHIFSPTRTIVSGATRVLSFVFGFASSSSSSSSSDFDSTSDDTDDKNDDQDVSSQGVHTVDREPRSFAGKNGTKHLIEQLLMRETFSREECDILTNIIKSRVVDSPTIRGIGLGRLNETPKRTCGSDVEINDFCSTAVMEARKWLEEKKSGSSSKSELQYGTCALNSVTLTHSIEGEAGSPVDIAKSYMQSRPPWASPSMNNIKFRSPSPIGMPLFKEETPYSIGGNSLSLSKRKRESPATGSWNIQEEIRKVRSKATEEMLRTLSSPKIDWSSFGVEHKRGCDSLVANNSGPPEEDNPQSSKKSVDEAVDLAARPASQITQDALHNDALPRPATDGCEQNQGMEAIQSIEGGRDETLDVEWRLQSPVDIKVAPNSDDVAAADVNHLKKTNGSILQFSSNREGTVLGSQVADINCSTLKEDAGIGGVASTANRFPCSGSSKSAELDKEQNHRPINEEDKAVDSGHGNATRVAEENCELLSEASMEVPIVNEIDAVGSGPQNSSSMQYEGSPQQLNTPKSKSRSAGKSNPGMEKQQGKKLAQGKDYGIGMTDHLTRALIVEPVFRYQDRGDLVGVRSTRMDSSIAQKTWELENNILTVETPDPSSDFIFFYDEAAQAKFQQERPWANDPHYFKRVKISALALPKMVVHARSGGTIEVMGLMQGKTDGDATIVMDAFALPVEGTETMVNAQADAYEYMVDYSLTNKQAGRLENVVGWYHSHPGYGCWLSGIDVSTQMLNQQFQEPFLAVVIDPRRTFSAGKVEIGAFRTYPEGYKPPDGPISEYQTIPLNKIEDFGVHCKQYYALDITYFKSSLDCTSWIFYGITEKLEQAENQLAHARIGPLGPPRKEEESQLSKITRDSAKITVERVHGLMSQVIKDFLFNSVLK